jgi:hypothetical protein
MEASEFPPEDEFDVADELDEDEFDAEADFDVEDELAAGLDDEDFAEEEEDL